MKTTKLQTHLIGQKFGRLTVLSVYKKEGVRGQWCNCVCECGGFHDGLLPNVRNGRTSSCGCLVNGSFNVTHGKSKTKVYNCWNGMRARCSNENAPNYSFYGGRGISVCPEWRDSFEAFYACIGDPPTKHHSIDRINNDGNYEPSNCRWATKKEQNKNRRKYKSPRKQKLL